MRANKKENIDLHKYLDEWSFALGDKTSTMWGSTKLSIKFLPIANNEETKSAAP
jgi:hypothetical protein